MHLTKFIEPLLCASSFHLATNKSVHVDFSLVETPDNKKSINTHGEQYRVLWSILWRATEKLRNSMAGGAGGAGGASGGRRYF